MLSQAIGDLLPSAVGVALSPIPIIAVILMLATPRARSNGLAFGLGWIAGLVIVSVVVLLVAGGADTSSTTNDALNWVKLALGVAARRGRCPAGRPDATGRCEFLRSLAARVGRHQHLGLRHDRG